MTEYRFNPGWMATSTFGSGGADLTASDLGVIVEILGRFGTMTADEAHIANVTALAEAPATTEGYTVTIAHDEARRVGAFRTLGHAVKGVQRVRHATIGDAPMFLDVAVTDSVARYTLAGGPTVTRSHWAFGKVIKRDADRSAMQTYRQYVALDADQVARFKSSLSLPVLGRALAWIRANTATGLPEASAYRHDVDADAFMFTLSPVEVPSVFGFRIARTRPNYLLPALDRVVADLKRTGISMRVTPRMAGGAVVMIGVILREIRAVDVDMSREDPHDVRYDGLPVEHFKRPPVAASAEPVSEVFTLMDDEASEPVDVAPVESAETIAAPEPVSRPRGRMKGIAIDHHDNVAAAPVAPPVATEPEPSQIDRSVVYDPRPMWLRRRFNYTRETLPSLWADRPIATNDELADALRAGVNVWAYGMDARPATYYGLPYDEGCRMLMDDWNMSRERSYWCTHMLSRPHVEWSDDEGNYLPTADDDPEGDLVASSRTKPRDLTKISGRPHDGLGFVDDDGNPVDDEGNPVDRCEQEEAWDDRVPRITEIA